MIRRGEAEYKQAQAEVATMNDADVIDWMIANPKVIERPIVVSARGARIGRPPESVLEIIA